MGTFTHHTDHVSSLVVHNGELYSASYDTTVKRCSLEGTVMQEYKGHTDWVYTLAMWRGTLFSGGSDDRIIQWRIPPPLWSTSTHKMFSVEVQNGVKTMMLLVLKQHIPAQTLPTEILFVIFQYYASWSIGKN